MGIVFSLLGLVCSLGSFVFGLVLLYRMYQKAGIVQAILGFICGLWAYIWGWMNIKDEKFQNMPIMLTLTGFIVGNIIFQALGAMFSGN